MNILIVSCVYPPEPVVSAQTSASLAAGLVARGDRVKVITAFPNRPAGKLYPGYRRRLIPQQENQNGLSLLRCFTFISTSSSMLSRWLENISFGVTSGFAASFSEKPDLIYANTWPIFAAGLLILVSKLRGIPVVLSVQDLYPESLAAQGRVEPDYWLYQILFQLDRWISNQAHAIVVISTLFRDSYTQSRGIQPSKIHLIPNWIESNAITLQDKLIFRKEAGISKDAFVLVYGGNIGSAAGVETIIEAVRNANLPRETVLLIAGSGSSLENCRKLAEGIEKVRILFHSPWLPEETSAVLASADILLLPTIGNQSLASAPSKLLSYMLAARPVLAIVQGQSDTAQLIRKSGCGWVIEPSQIDQMTVKLEELAEMPDPILKRMGSVGRQYALENFTSEQCVPQLIKILSCLRN